jgi:hypothetical protein
MYDNKQKDNKQKEDSKDIISEQKKMWAKHKTHFDELKGGRKNWDNHWKEIADYVIPRKDDVYRTDRQTTGEKKSNKAFLFDSTAIDANEKLASALHSMLTNPSKYFFNFTTGDPDLDKDDSVRKYLQKITRLTHEVLNSSNFQTEIHEVYLDLGSFGTSILQIEEDKEKIVRFRARPIYDGYIAENSKGIVDTLYREEWMALEVIADQFGYDKLTPELQRELERKPRCKKQVIHCVYPRRKRDRKKLDGRNKKFGSIYLLHEAPVILSESGFNEFPYLVPRWTKIAGEMYGRSPAMKCLPSVKMLNAMMETTIRSGQLQTLPPLGLPDDGYMLPLNLSPGALNYYRAGTQDKIEPLFTGARVDFGFPLIERVMFQISEAFFLNELKLREGPQKTAQEVMQLSEENQRILAPQLARQYDELLRPLIDKVFNIMDKADMFPETPAIIAERELKVRYSSDIAKAQRVSESQNITRAISLASPFIEMSPESVDNLDSDAALRVIGDIFGVPEEIFRDQEEVAKLRQGRAQAQMQQQQMDQQMAEAEALNKAGPAMLQAQEQGAF